MPVLLKDSLAEVREVDVTILDNVVGQVNDLLLHGVQAQHLHGCVQVLEYVILNVTDSFFYYMMERLNPVFTMHFL